MEFILATQQTVYHGSRTPLDGFDMDKQSSGYYPGFYVTTSLDMTKDFGDMVYSFTLVGKTFDLGREGDALKRDAMRAGFYVTQANGNGEVEYLKSLGYDAIKRGVEHIVFDPQSSLLNQELV